MDSKHLQIYTTISNSQQKRKGRLIGEPALHNKGTPADVIKRTARIRVWRERSALLT